MDTLSSSFLQKYVPSHSLTPSPPLRLLLKFNISSLKIDEKYDRLNHQKSMITTSIMHQKKLKTLNTPKNPSTSEITKIKKQSFLTIFFNSLDNFICNFIDPPLRPSIDPNHVLSGNFAPVNELPPTACDVVEGSLPPSLNGAYIRNGPNPQFIPSGPYHLFDGDGMLHAVTISGGEATFCSRFVKTYKYTLEREIGSPVILNVFSAFNGLLASLARYAVSSCRALAGQYDPSRGVGRANTSLSLISGKLFAHEECDLPYGIKLTCDGDIITLGRHEFLGEPLTAMTAHPKIDMEAGETFAFRYSFLPPFLTYFRLHACVNKL